MCKNVRPQISEWSASITLINYGINIRFLNSRRNWRLCCHSFFKRCSLYCQLMFEFCVFTQSITLRKLLTCSQPPCFLLLLSHFLKNFLGFGIVRSKSKQKRKKFIVHQSNVRIKLSYNVGGQIVKLSRYCCV